MKTREESIYLKRTNKRYNLTAAGTRQQLLHVTPRR